MIKRIAYVVAAAALVAGCSSGVDLDNVPVEDKSGTPLSSQGSQSGNAGQSGVQGVDLSQSAADKAGPVGVSRVVYFDFDSYVIKPEFQAVIEAHARFIKASPARRAVIEGHTDERGGREYNLALGQRRADAIKKQLVLMGAPESQIESVSLGKEKPKALGDNEAAWAENRRGDMLYNGEY